MRRSDQATLTRTDRAETGAGGRPSVWDRLDRSAPGVAAPRSGAVPTHGDLPDPDALWRLSGGHGPPPSSSPSRRSGSAGWAGILATVAVIAVVALAPDALYGAAAAIVSFMDAAPAFPQCLLYIAVAAIPVTLVHELGHAIVARWLLGTPVSVAVGSIGEIAQLHLGQIAVSINALGSPARVGGSATFDSSRARALDILLIALAGPLASAVGLLVSLALLGASPITGFVHDVVWTSALGGVFAVMNLVPFAFQEHRGGPSLQTDGRLALDAARTLHALR